MVESGVEPRINLIRLKQRISSANSEFDSLNDQIPNLQDKLARTEVVAPKDGIVNRVLVTTAGGVVQPGNPIIEMIPIDDELILEVEVAPTDIAYVIKDQKAIVQLSAFDFNVYGSLEGVVLNVSADTIKKEDRLIKINKDYGITLLVIEHNMKVIMSLAQSIFCLAHGKLLAEGSPDQIKNDKRVVDAYLGAQ